MKIRTCRVAITVALILALPITCEAATALLASVPPPPKPALVSKPALTLSPSKPTLVSKSTLTPAKSKLKTQPPAKPAAAIVAKPATAVTAKPATAITAKPTATVTAKPVAVTATPAPAVSQSAGSKTTSNRPTTSPQKPSANGGTGNSNPAGRTNVSPVDRPSF